MELPSARTRRALIATWFAEPVVIRRAQDRTSADVTAMSTTQDAVPKAIARRVASTTPAITPTLRSMPLVKDCWRLGCTTSMAAIAAKTGGGPSATTAPARTQASIVARAVFTSWSTGSRVEARTDVSRMTTP